MEGTDGLHLHQLHRVEEEVEEEKVEEVEKVVDVEKKEEDLVKVKGGGSGRRVSRKRM